MAVLRFWGHFCLRRIRKSTATRSRKQSAENTWSASWNDLSSHRKIQLICRVEIRGYQVQIIYLYAAVVSLRIQEIQKRSRAVLVRKGDGVPYAQSLLQVALLVWLKKKRVAGYCRVGGIDVAEDLRPGSVQQFLIAVDVQLGALFFTLVAIENAQRDVPAESDILVDWRISSDVKSQSGVCGTVGYRKTVIRSGFVHRLQGGLQVRPGLQRGLPHLFQWRDFGREIKSACDVELIQRR